MARDKLIKDLKKRVHGLTCRVEDARNFYDLEAIAKAIDKQYLVTVSNHAMQAVHENYALDSQSDNSKII